VRPCARLQLLHSQPRRGPTVAAAALSEGSAARAAFCAGLAALTIAGAGALCAVVDLDVLKSVW